MLFCRRFLIGFCSEYLFCHKVGLFPIVIILTNSNCMFSGYFHTYCVYSSAMNPMWILSILTKNCPLSCNFYSYFFYFYIGDKNALRNILLYHLTQGVFIGSGFEPGVTNILKTIQGGKLYLKTVKYRKYLPATAL